MEVCVHYMEEMERRKEWSLLTIAWHYKRLNSSKW